MRSPLYVEVAGEIKQRIDDGIFKPGEKLMSEPELARILGVSRGTLREALTSLENDRIISRKHGKGAFVNKNTGKIVAGIEKLESLTNTIRQAGHRAEDKVLSSRRITLDEEKAAMLEQNNGAVAFAVESLRLSDHEPVIYCFDLVPLSLVSGMVKSNEDFIALRKKCESMSDFYDKYTRYKPKQYASTVNAVVAPAYISDLLEVDSSMPMIFMEGVMYDEAGLPINYGYQYFRSDKYTFNLVRRK
jgi:GntR family transcriptional regulator